MIATLDYLGFRLICLSLLPVNSKTLIYGSSNGGQTNLFPSDNRLYEQLEELGKKLNFKPHLVGVQNQAMKMTLPVDIEVKLV